jgi:hypothetical protein
MHVHAFMAETTGLTMVGGLELCGYLFERGKAYRRRRFERRTYVTRVCWFSRAEQVYALRMRCCKR